MSAMWQVSLAVKARDWRGGKFVEGASSVVLRICLVLGACGSVLSAVGCSSGSAIAPVSGVVTYKGKPVPNANVSFTPAEGAGRAAAGLTDSSGRFTLGTFSARDGALPCKYRISVIAYGPSRPAKPGETGSGMPGEMMPGDPTIPKKYFAPDTSGLTSEVKRGRNYVELDLKD
jgi:hypothetical protein